MPATVIIAIILATGFLPFAIWCLMPADAASRSEIRKNLSRGMEVADPTQDSLMPSLMALGDRLVLPANRRLIDKLLGLAGRPQAWPLARLVVAKPLLAVIAASLGLLLLSAGPSGPLLALVILLVVVAYFIPDLLLYSRGIERQAAIGLELPDTLDQMLIAVEAGLGFEASMSRAGQNGKGPLAEELVRTLQDMRVGMSRREAYQLLAERTAVPDLRAFIRAVVQADMYGISISAVLRAQAKEMRTKRRQRAEEKAMKIPVKVLFPLMLFILPVLFIAVLGPTVITIVSTFL
ncbi:tight adherence protein C [Arthrobacter silviterrae]|uniref:Type II secretion system F family protein n=1 Tax=Arthrobacter silviterrae TaxID=2026658 RepID=A0ABX0DD34_9MICC|nr:type II secretion system F family protein [Arthrobacter silviterrae]MDQ0278853.1 tight adherence protein C [Arthrobacter silviterrae]NGN84837.1 type II secretion system F family protein [Arthrobacter silviterrae]